MKMNYCVLGTRDMAAAEAFYDALFAGMGLQKAQPSEQMTYWLGADFAFALALPFDGAPATVGNGSMLGFSFDSADEVRRRYDLALAHGGTSEGEPGPRGPKFSAYVRDLDGNKLCLSD